MEKTTRGSPVLPEQNNTAMAAGIIKEAPREMVKNHGVLMYKGNLHIPKPDGKTEYCIPYQIRADMLTKAHIGAHLLFQGEFRTRNDKSSGKLQLRVYFHIKAILPASTEECINEVCIVGYLCSEPYFKSKKMEKGNMTLTSADIAVHRPEKVSDYIPCTFYGSLAYMMKTARVSSKYLIHGRMVNRNYFYYGEQRTSYELQVYKAYLLEEPEFSH